MHGILLLHLKPFIGEKLDEEDAWSLLFQRAGVPHTVFLPYEQYDKMLSARVIYAAAELRSEDIRTFLRGYGRVIFPALLRMYGHTFRLPQSGKLFAMLEQIDGVYARMRGTGMTDPPRMVFDRESHRKGVLHFRSDSDGMIPEICELAHGMIEGATQEFGEQVGVKHTDCVLTGARFCSFELRPRIKSSTAFPRVEQILNGRDDESED